MKRDYIAEIIRLFFRERFSRNMEEKVQHWLIDEEHVEEKDHILFEQWDRIELEPDMFIFESLEAVNKKIMKKPEQPVQPVKKVSLRYRWLRIAAVFLPLVLIAGGYLYFNRDIIGEEWITIETAYGEQKRITLPDGSDIRLNVGSSISYPQQFLSGIRTVHLKGEAYFIVKKDSLHPFIVETGPVSVKVLGTEFNVTAYPEEDKVTTTLTSGKVQVETVSEEVFVLHPAQQLSFYSETSRYNMEEVEVENVNGWMKGALIFDRMTLKEIVRLLERHFDVVIEVDQTLLTHTEQYTVKFLHRETLEEVLNVLQDISGFDYRIENDKVMLYTK